MQSDGSGGMAVREVDDDSYHSLLLEVSTTRIH